DVNAAPGYSNFVGFETNSRGQRVPVFRYYNVNKARIQGVETEFKTPSALSYTVHKLENDLNIQLLDRSGHRARFTRTGKMLLEK
ncbi:LysR family transcriptional regulator, partial [Salmonella enterica subsp. enterica serovar Virginia]|nr:LysR family transcriptional regulator [Salmonella enterica subsp. enterica serovar Virginia]